MSGARSGAIPVDQDADSTVCTQVPSKRYCLVTISAMLLVPQEPGHCQCGGAAGHDHPDAAAAGGYTACLLRARLRACILGSASLTSLAVWTVDSQLQTTPPLRSLPTCTRTAPRVPTTPRLAPCPSRPQGQMQRQAQELQQRLLLEAQAVAAAAAAAAAGQPGSAAAAAAAAALNPQFAPGGLPGLFLPQHGQLGTGIGTAAVAGLGAATAAAQQQLGAMVGGLGAGSLVPLGALGVSGVGGGLGLASGAGLGGVNGGGSPGATGVLVPISGVTASSADPRMVLSPRTWQLEPVGGSGVVNGLAGSPAGSPGRGVYGRGPSVGGTAAAALYPAPARD